MVCDPSPIAWINAPSHFKQAITGAAEGVIAAFSAYEHTSKK